MSAGFILFVVLVCVAVPCTLLHGLFSKPDAPAAPPASSSTPGGWDAGYAAGVADAWNEQEAERANAFLLGFKDGYHRLLTYEILAADHGWDYAPGVRENMLRLARRDVDDVKARIVEWAQGAGQSPDALLDKAESLLDFDGGVSGVRAALASNVVM